MSTPLGTGDAGIRVATVRAVPIYLAYSWFIILAFILLTFGPLLTRNFDSPVLGYSLAAGYALLLLLSVLVHELAHALTAQYFGWPSTRIVLNLWGGHTQFDGADPTPGKSAVVSVVGPAANLVLAGLGYLLSFVFEANTPASVLVNIFVFTNFLVGMFNVLPGLPLDGGRLVEAAVWKLSGKQHRGTLIAGYVGMVLAVAIVLIFAVGTYLQSSGQVEFTRIVIAVLVGIFMFQGALQSVRWARMKETLSQLSAHSLRRPAQVLGVDALVSDVLNTAQQAPGQPIFLYDQHSDNQHSDNQHSVNLHSSELWQVNNAALSSVPENAWHTTAAHAVAIRLGAEQLIAEQLSGQGFVAALEKAGQHDPAIIDAQGQITGYVRISDAIKALKGQ